jgi:hypothetical protein
MGIDPLTRAPIWTKQRVIRAALNAYRASVPNGPFKIDPTLLAPCVTVAVGRHRIRRFPAPSEKASHKKKITGGYKCGLCGSFEHTKPKCLASDDARAAYARANAKAG